MNKKFELFSPSAFHRNLKISAALICVSAGLIAGANEEAEDPIVADPTVLTAFNSYKLTDLGNEAEVNSVYDTLRGDLMNNANGACYQRAQVWSYQMQQTKQIQSGKVFLFYAYGANGSWNFNGMGWWFHVAPYVVANGEEFVMEKMFSVRSPLKMEEWLKTQTGGKICKELIGTELDLLDSIRRNYSMPATYAPCYYRKTPMTYHHPMDVYNHDVKNQSVMATQISSGWAYSSCLGTLSAFSNRDRKAKCSSFANDPLSLPL